MTSTRSSSLFFTPKCCPPPRAPTAPTLQHLLHADGCHPSALQMLSSPSSSNQPALQHSQHSQHERNGWIMVGSQWLDNGWIGPIPGPCKCLLRRSNMLLPVCGMFYAARPWLTKHALRAAISWPCARHFFDSKNCPARPLRGNFLAKTSQTLGSPLVYGIDYCLLDSLFYTPSTFYDPSVHRSISQSLREVVRRRKFALVSRSSAVRHLLKAIGFPTSTATLSRRPWPSSIAPSRRLYRPVAEVTSSRRRAVVV